LESAKIAKQARAENRSMKEIALQKLLKPEEMQKKLAQKMLDENKPGRFCSLF
jgi:aspartate ammonia-lyase